MRRIALVILAFTLCIMLCSCESLLVKIKSAVTGEAISEMPDDYIVTLENDQFSYELYESYVKIIAYLGEDTEVKIPSKIDGKPVKVIGDLCFFDTEADVTSVEIPDSVTAIESDAFYYADKLLSIVIPDSVTSIGSRAFGWCNSLAEVTIGTGVTELPDYCFNHCIALTSVKIPSNVEKIGLRAFSYCENIGNITIPENINEVGERAFFGCTALKFITFENSEVVLGADLFEETAETVLIAPELSSAYDYCVEYGLRWSLSESVPAIVPTINDLPDVSE